MKKKEENICFCGGEKNEDGKGGKYLEKENIFFAEEKEKEEIFWRRDIYHAYF